MAAAALTVSAGRCGEWLEELERICDSVERLPEAAHRAVLAVAVNLMDESATSAGERARATALLATLEHQQPAKSRLISFSRSRPGLAGSPIPA
jgi:hypothetical protein